MELITFLFLIIALSVYVLFGGADFGGGLLEVALRGHPGLQKKLQATLAPVWEANHVWLIAVVVILFVGFPLVYATLSTLLFVPISLALMGIILRGAFFTFRKYDPQPTEWNRYYGWLFRLSSGITPLMFGFIVTALLRPFPLPATAAAEGFYAVYMAPWLTLFGLLGALFVNVLFAYLAAVFFYGEVQHDADRQIVRKRLLLFFSLSFVSGGLVLVYGGLSGSVNAAAVFHPVQIGAQAAALGGIALLWQALKRQHGWLMRLAVGIQVLSILLGWFITQYPVFIRFSDGTQLTVANGAAPEITLFWLNLGLAVVLALVVPMLVYLYRVFGVSKVTG